MDAQRWTTLLSALRLARDEASRLKVAPSDGPNLRELTWLLRRAEENATDLYRAFHSLRGDDTAG